MILSVIVIAQIAVMALWMSDKNKVVGRQTFLVWSLSFVSKSLSLSLQLLDLAKKAALKTITDKYKGDLAKDETSLIWTMVNSGVRT